MVTTLELEQLVWGTGNLSGGNEICPYESEKRQHKETTKRVVDTR